MGNKQSFEAEYIVELNYRSFHTSTTLHAENISEAISSVIEDEIDSIISILIVGDFSGDSNITPLLDYDALL